MHGVYSLKFAGLLELGLFSELLGRKGLVDTIVAVLDHGEGHPYVLNSYAE